MDGTPVCRREVGTEHDKGWVAAATSEPTTLQHPVASQESEKRGKEAQQVHSEHTPP